MQQTSVAVPDLDTDVPARRTQARTYPFVDDATLAAHREGRPGAHQRGLGRLETFAGLRAFSLVAGGFCAVVGVIIEVVMWLSPGPEPHPEMHVGAAASLLVVLVALLWPWPKLRIVIAESTAAVREKEFSPQYGDTHRAVAVEVGDVSLPVPPEWAAQAPFTFAAETAIAERIARGKVVWRALLWVRPLRPREHPVLASLLGPRPEQR
jgi:hypothetical protein